MTTLPKLLKEVRACTVCKDELPLGPRPVLTVHRNARVLIVGQAPGLKVHQSGTPWDDASGDRLRAWMGLSREQFYDPKRVALLPMGFCYPGKGKSGDLPPRKECAPLWHADLLAHMPHVALTLVVGLYAQAHYLEGERPATLTETVKAWKSFLPRRVPLPHPSPRNNIWLKKNPWFERDLVPVLQRRVRRVLA